MIEIVGVSKNYGNTRAVQALSLSLQRGRISGIVGPNGAGKSTLMRLIAGEEWPDEGQFRLDARAWHPGRADNIGIVHQDPMLWGNLTVGENLLVGREGRRFARPRPSAAAREILAELGLGDFIDVPVSELSLAMQQRVEIGRALARDADVFLFDEPNSALTVAESEYLFARMRGLAAEGKVVILVSHRLDEIAENCDDIALVRGGLLANHWQDADLTAQALAEHLTGDGQRATVSAQRSSGADTGVKIARWLGEKFAVSDFSAAAGEVTAIVGVEGSGAREFLASLARLVPAEGEITLLNRQGSGKLLDGKSVFLAGDRRQTVFAHLSVAENLMLRRRLASVPRRGFFLDRAGVTAAAEVMRRGNNIKCDSVNDAASTLSGGNQQKMVVASAIAAEPLLILVEEPTRGVDVGSRREIYDQLRAYAAAGNVVIALCTEETEAFELAHKTAVFDRGTVIAELFPADYEGAEHFAGAIAGTIADFRRSQRH
jgi:ABC-type sugar transport system ATPase subunit